MNADKSGMGATTRAKQEWEGVYISHLRSEWGHPGVCVGSKKAVVCFRKRYPTLSQSARKGRAPASVALHPDWSKWTDNIERIVGAGPCGRMAEFGLFNADVTGIVRLVGTGVRRTV
jgi:hypothetical protein